MVICGGFGAIETMLVAALCSIDKHNCSRSKIDQQKEYSSNKASTCRLIHHERNGTDRKPKTEKNHSYKESLLTSTSTISSIHLVGGNVSVNIRNVEGGNIRTSANRCHCCCHRQRLPPPPTTTMITKDPARKE